MLINDDCFDHLPKIESESVDLILTDPPYDISKKSGFKSGKSTKFNIISIDFGYWDREIDLENLFIQYYRILKQGGTLLIFYDIWKSTLIKQFAESVGFKQPRIGQWLKTNPVPVNSKTNYLSNSSEYFFTFIKGKKPTFNSKYDRGIYNYPLCHGRERLDHPTQKPLELIKDLILKHSKSGDLVLDSFSGVGTTAIACIETDRKFICIERDQKYFELSESRLVDFQQQIEK